MKSENITYIPAIDHLRAAAALLIVLYHGITVISYKLKHGDPFTFDHWLSADNPVTALLVEGHTAVALFMVLSGFIFTFGCYGQNISYKGFIFNRFVRTYPLLIAVLFIAISKSPKSVTFDSLLTTLLFMGNTPGAVNISPFTSMFWAVSVEWQFYLIFPFLLMFLNHKGMKFLAFLMLTMITFRILSISLGGSARDMSYWTILGRMDQFLLGMIAGVIFKTRPFSPLVAGGLLVAAIAMLLVYLQALNSFGGWPIDHWWKILTPTVEAIIWGTIIISYIPLARFLPNVLARPAALIGKISYSIYLIHFVILHAFVSQAQYFIVSDSSSYYNAVATTLVYVVPTTLAVSFLTFKTLEEPFLKLRKKYKRQV